MKLKQEQLTPLSKDLRSFFCSLTKAEKEKAMYEISCRCLVAVSTVDKWRLGARNPKERYEDIIRKYINSFKREVAV